MKSRIFILTVLVSCMFMATIVINAHNTAFAQLNQSQLNQSAVIFRNVEVDTNPVPNKPFKVNAIISVSDIQRRHVLLSLSVPNQISIAGSGITDLGDISSGDGQRKATWTLVPTASGSFGLNLTAYSSSTGVGNTANNYQASSFLFNVSIGSIKSLIISRVNMPGDILPNNIFTASVNLRNTGTIPADNVIAQLSVPSNLQLLDNVASNIESIKAGGEVPMSWRIKALAPGSFNINFNYSSTNAGSGAVQATANVGQPLVNNIRPSDITLAGSQLTSSKVGPGDTNLPLNISLVNDGTLPLVNVTAKLDLSEPFFWSYKDKGRTIETHSQTFYAGTMKNGESNIAPYFISIRKSATPYTYTNQLTVSFSDGKQQYQKVYDIPILVSPNVALMVIAKPAPLNPGDYTPVTFNIVNKGEVPLHRIQLLSSDENANPVSPNSPPLHVNPQSSGATVITSDTSPTISNGPYLSVDTPYWIGDLGVGENKSLTLKVYTLNERIAQLPLPITIGYQANGKSTTETYVIGVKILGNPAFQIKTVRVSPPLVYPGSVGIRMNVAIMNSGYVIANNVSAQLIDLPHGLAPAWGNATSQFFGRILPNENVTGSFFLNVNNDVYSEGAPLTLLIKYNNKDTQKLYTNFLVSPKAKFDFLSVDSSGVYSGATNVPIKVNLKNTGTAIAQTLTAKFLGGNTVPGVKSNTQTVIGNKEDIGDIPPGATFPTTFILNASPQTKGQQAASIEITWTQSDTAGSSQTNTFVQTVPITYDVAEGPNYLFYYNGIPLTYIAIGAIIAGLFVLFAVQRRRKNRSIEAYLQRQSVSTRGNGPTESEKESKGSPLGLKG